MPQDALEPGAASSPVAEAPAGAPHRDESIPSRNSRRQLLQPASRVESMSQRDRSRSPVPAHVPMNVHAETRGIVLTEFGKFASQEMQTNIHKECMKLEADIDSLQKTRSKITQLEQNLQHCASEGTLPKGCKPLGFSYTGKLLDTLKSEPISLNIVIDENMTIREAKQHVHQQTMILQWKLDLALMNARRNELRESTKLSQFMTKTRAARTERVEAWDLLDLDLSDEALAAPQRSLSDSELTDKLLSVYKKTIDLAAKKKLSQKQEDSRTLKSREDLVKAVSEKTPMQHLETAIDSRVEDALKKRDKKSKEELKKLHEAEKRIGVKVNTSDLAAKALSGSMLTDDQIKAAISDEPKNDPAPPRGGRKEKAKAKTKAQQPTKPDTGTDVTPSTKGGKGKSKGKGKGKGKSKPNAGPKAKAKAKANNQPQEQTSGGKGKGGGKTKGRGKGKRQ